MAHRTCSVDGCENPVNCRGWCRKHYSRWQRHGDPTHLVSRGDRNVDASGYVRVRAPGHPVADTRGWAAEHRVVAWDTFGPFDLSCHVHHKNHDRSDNRAENLEVLTPEAHNALHAAKNRKVDVDRVIELYTSGLSTVAVAERVGSWPGNIHRMLTSAGVKVRGMGEAKRVAVDDDELRRLHAQPGIRVPQIAEALGIGHNVVRRRMKELGLPSFPAGRRHEWATNNPIDAKRVGLSADRLGVR